MKMSEFLSIINEKVIIKERQVELEKGILNAHLRGYRDGLTEIAQMITEQKESPEVKPEVKVKPEAPKGWPEVKPDIKPEPVKGPKKPKKVKETDEVKEKLKARVLKMYQEGMSYSQIRECLRVHDAFIASCIPPEDRRKKSAGRPAKSFERLEDNQI
jgi:hypothetical protein